MPLPETKTLWKLLSEGAEGGKQFARIVDLLRFHAARREGRKILIFNDAAGDYLGLDGLDGDTGYQYKFYDSPLGPAHRAEIKQSLKHTASKEGATKLRKWILVMPENLTESATKKGGGDVSWFEGLKAELGLAFDIEHWGHRQLQALFIEAPSLALFYYPDLVPDGAYRSRSIQDVRGRLDENMREKYRRIEFVGMSVYKPEATRGVPMEDIYIPLATVPAASPTGDRNVPRTNPLTFLTRGTRHVVLGDPGSGKSTLLRFLALAGIAPPLQERYAAKADGRLPVLVILRRYADELKTHRNLSLLEYIQETIRADFSLPGADAGFLEYYLDSGEALLFFDGLDELPNPDLKETVRDRIDSLLISYPGNTAIVTSRIVGYDHPFRFDEERFTHVRLSPLQLPEMERFVRDWYRARIDVPTERDDHANDLIRILRHDTHAAIHELAQNPLLLTIIALVHRIDAVLPDERVVLYQKCTETLLNTWHTWKFRSAEQPARRGRTERRNRQRIEAIAHWMHTRDDQSQSERRAVVAARELERFLTDHIRENERHRDDDDDPEDQATAFLDFVRQRAGLLIEAGDGLYGFVHLTFQEYLTASYFMTQCEEKGVAGIWPPLDAHRRDPAWHEVIRLLVAGLRGNRAQEIVVDEFLGAAELGPDASCARLLGGFLLDGVAAAEETRDPDRPTPLPRGHGGLGRHRVAPVARHGTGVLGSRRGNRGVVSSGIRGALERDPGGTTAAGAHARGRGERDALSRGGEPGDDRLRSRIDDLSAPVAAPDGTRGGGTTPGQLGVVRGADAVRDIGIRHFRTHGGRLARPGPRIAA